MPYNFAASSFHIKKLCSRLSWRECDFRGERALLQFLRPALGDLRAMHNDRLWLIGKRVVDMLLLLIDLFSRCYGWRATSECRFKIGDFALTGAGWPKISGTRCRPTNRSTSRKTRRNDLTRQGSAFYKKRIFHHLYKYFRQRDFIQIHLHCEAEKMHHCIFVITLSISSLCE